MTQKSRNTPAPDVEEQAPKDAAEPKGMSLDAYLEKHTVHPGLVASYRYEARTRAELLQEKTESAWKLAFEQQSKTQY
ncbi:hypothetical protein [Paenibacillus durus]|uniref:Uncharacterized protein n=1 Tax=Paenibacillus durus ATCC 35681 TaxID=1333534 RepID=A0A0F7FCL7_PAEDU|nr:hypothetical protein [Paenibacillus durus]AKG36088.1 hypothetical protein VK70_17260 [Paenibacillus durus ATCC 35681]